MFKMKSESVSGFDGFGLNPALLRGIREAGFVSPREIQRETIPAALQGRDILGLAQTGTGKTAAFALPVLDRLLSLPRKSGPRVLIVAPTRELVSQIEEEVRLLGRFTQIKSVTPSSEASRRALRSMLCAGARRSWSPVPGGCSTCTGSECSTSARSNV